MGLMILITPLVLCRLGFVRGHRVSDDAVRTLGDAPTSIWRVAKEWSDLRNAHSKSQQFTVAHSTEFKIAVIVLASHRAIQEPAACNFISKHSHSTVTACCNLLWNLLGSDHSLATRHIKFPSTARTSLCPHCRSSGLACDHCDERIYTVWIRGSSAYCTFVTV